MPWYGYALLAGVCITLIGILQKRILKKEHSLEYVTVFSVIRLIFVLAVFSRHIDWTITVGQAGLLIAGAGFGSMAFLLTIKAIRRFEYSTITPIMALEPGLVAMLAVASLGESFAPWQWAGLALITLGAYGITLFNENRDWRQVLRGPGHVTAPIIDALRRPGGWYIWVALASFSISALFARRVLTEVTPATYLFYDILILALIYVGMMVVRQERISIHTIDWRVTLFIIPLISAIHLLNSWLSSVALTLAPVGLVIAMKRTSTLFDIVVGGRLFHEHRLRGKLLATLLILLGTLLIVQA